VHPSWHSTWSQACCLHVECPIAFTPIHP
jgi:hypothetical protein